MEKSKSIEKKTKIETKETIKVDTVYKKEEIKRLKFNQGGWCNELNKSYEKGFYMPKTIKEYKILKAYSE